MRIRTQVRGKRAKHYCRLEELLHMLTASTTHKVVVCLIWQVIYGLKEEKLSPKQLSTIEKLMINHWNLGCMYSTIFLAGYLVAPGAPGVLLMGRRKAFLEEAVELLAKQNISAAHRG